MKKAHFKNGTKILKMKIQTENKDGSVILIDGSKLEKEEIIKIETFTASLSSKFK